MDAWTFIWLMVFLKIPIAALLGIIWWAVRDNPSDQVPAADDDGGSKHLPPRPGPRHPHRPQLPRLPRRGPHGGERLSPPVRVRTVNARARRVWR